MLVREKSIMAFTKSIGVEKSKKSYISGLIPIIGLYFEFLLNDYF